MTQFAVIDTETTGLQPSDRVIEFACAVLRQDGEVIRRMDTVVNSGRSPGPTRLHGLSAEVTEAAPTFGAVARSVFHLLNGRVVVAYNLAFDWMMLRKEFQRLGMRVPTNSGGLCTADLSRIALGRTSSLRTACELLGIDLLVEHRARTDVEATVRLLKVLRARLGALPPHRPLVMEGRLGRLPAPAPFVPRADPRAPAGHKPKERSR